MNDGVSAMSSNSLEDYETKYGQSQSFHSTPVEKPTKPAYYQHEIEEDKPKAVENLFSDVSCCCFPTCASSPSAILSRTWLWFLANSDQFMSSIIVAVNLIPEAISYGVMAGLGPRAALQSCWIANMATSLVGGRPGMISGASGLMALVLSRLVQTGVEDGEGGMISGITFVPYAIGFAGVLQSVSSIFGLGRLATSFPAPVVVGMVNAVAILTLALQCRYAKEYAWNEDALAEQASAGESAVKIEWNIALVQYFGEGFEWITPYVNFGVYGAEVALALAICSLMPRVTTIFPATLFSILLVVAVDFGIVRQLGVETPLIRDYGGAQVRLHALCYNL
jgi:MFS superfamily sulfate permease-like transporter